MNPARNRRSASARRTRSAACASSSPSTGCTSRAGNSGGMGPEWVEEADRCDDMERVEALRSMAEPEAPVPGTSTPDAAPIVLIVAIPCQVRRSETVPRVASAESGGTRLRELSRIVAARLQTRLWACFHRERLATRYETPEPRRLPAPSPHSALPAPQRGAVDSDAYSRRKRRGASIVRVPARLPRRYGG